MEIYQSVQILISGIVAGFILFQSAIIAPTVFTVVSVESRGPLLRKVFPKLFKLIAIFGSVFLVLALLRQSDSITGYLVGGASLLSGVICDRLVPMTNKARDSGDDAKFAKLHRLSVIMTMTVLLLNLFWIAFD